MRGLQFVKEEQEMICWLMPVTTPYLSRELLPVKGCLALEGAR